jgi:hypothetical protein
MYGSFSSYTTLKTLEETEKPYGTHGKKNTALAKYTRTLKNGFPRFYIMLHKVKISSQAKL